MKQKQCIEKIKQFWGIRKNRYLAVAVAGCLVCVLIVSAVVSALGDQEETVYRETKAVYGILTVGITESGSVDIGTVEDTFDLDISELARNNASGSGSSSGQGSSSAGGMSGGMPGAGQSGTDMFSQIFNLASGSGQSSQNIGESTLEITQVVVTEGQKVEIGDILYLLSQENVDEIRVRLETDVDNAAADLELVYAKQEQSKLSASHTYDLSIAYGAYAQTEYDITIEQLESSVTEKQKSLELAKEELALYQSRLESARQDYQTARELYDGAKWSADNVDKQTSTYLYVEYENLKSQAESALETVERQVEELENNVSQAEENIEKLSSQLAQAERKLATGKLTARETYDLRLLAYNNAQETYDIAIAYLEEAAKEQEEIYAAAKERWETFQTQIQDYAVCATESGVVTDVHLESGDGLGTGDTLITLYDQDNVTVSVTVDEDDMTDVSEGSQANVVLTAFPDEVFHASVTEISDAVADSSGSISYTVTVTLEGDVSKLYQGMTGDVTFITKESSEVLYVSNRAITRKNGKSYVKVRSADGGIETVQVETGFSDGVNVEIKDGLSAGDVVLIESKVSD